MAQAVGAFDDAIAHLDSLISRLTSGGPAAASRGAPAAAQLMKPAVVSGAPIQKAEEVEDVKKDVKELKKKNEESPIPDIPKGRNLKLTGAKAATPPVASGNEQNDNFDKALMQVAVVESVESHPNSEKLYVCKVDVGGGVVKQVVAGLKKFVTIEELQGKKVCVILNLKTAKLAGQVSEAMILAGSVVAEDGSEIVKVLEPPSEAAPGDRVFQEGGAPSAAPAKQLSSKVWEKVVPLLKVKGDFAATHDMVNAVTTHSKVALLSVWLRLFTFIYAYMQVLPVWSTGGLAVFDSKPLVTPSGSIQVPGLPDGADIH